MRILALSNNVCANSLWEWLISEGHELVVYSNPLSEEWCREGQFDLTVSYTYKYILSQKILDALGGNVVNIHNSYLPYNRGASPNVWSIIEGTPRGVTLHYMDSGLDKGFIIAQRLVTEGDGETLASSYNNLDKNAKELFISTFKYYKYWAEMKKRPEGKGSYHSVEDTKKIINLIDSYDIKINEFLELIKQYE